MTIAMSEHVDAEPCDVLRGGDGPVYFLLSGRLYVVHEILGRWIEPEAEPRRPASGRVISQRGPEPEEQRDEAAEGQTPDRERAQVEHWLVVASVGRFGTPAVFRLQRRPAPPANGPDRWTARPEKR